MTITASLTTGIVRVAHGPTAAASLLDEIIETDHVDWETTMSVGAVEFHRTKAGPYPNHQLRISVRPSIGFAALNYMDHDDPLLPIAISYNPRVPRPRLYLVFNGSTGSVFPRAAAVPVSDARNALAEWTETWKRPTCIEWRPFDAC
jgi:Immunity protein Imm1